MQFKDCKSSLFFIHNLDTLITTNILSYQLETLSQFDQKIEMYFFNINKQENIFFS